MATWSGLAAASQPNNRAVPELVLCCAQQRDGITAGGLRAESFTVSPHWVRQGKGSISCEQYIEAASAVRRFVPRVCQPTEYHKIGHVAAWMATSGAAMSSAMGRHSVGSSNAMLAAVNADLGIWLPNLTVVQDKWRNGFGAPGGSAQPTKNPGRAEPDTRSQDQDEPSGEGEPSEPDPDGLKQQAVNSGRAAQTRVPLDEDKRRKEWRELLPRPRFDYTIKELLGWYHTQDRFVFITDGGHWENLGLVELLRRGCTTIFCVDASGDPPGSFAALREALNLESLELGQLSNIDGLDDQLRQLMPQANYLPARMTTTLRLERTGNTAVVIHYAKLQSSQDMPTELRRFAAADPTFPRYSTTRQFLTDIQFAYLFELGQDAGRQLREAALSPQPKDQPAAAKP